MIAVPESGSAANGLAPALSMRGLSVRGLSKEFGGRIVLQDFDLDVAPGEVVALLGANGSGKSTALKCIVGIERPDSGRILLEGADLTALTDRALIDARMRTAMVFQQIHLVRRRTALQNVCSGGLGRLSLGRSFIWAAFPRTLREEAMACLDRVGLADRAHNRVAALSGGQQQRVALARALCQRAAVLLADEPVSALDPAAAEQVMALMVDLARTEGLAVAAVLHQPELARRHADRLVGLRDGRIDFAGRSADIGAEQVDGLYLAPAARSVAHHDQKRIPA
ncbi:phosphonate ABC transporter ATP-binding protein [Microlunatus soli]|uniref:Phosphonate transport system ATP-binding protein n=1 Tax=Microlunatus soli TaxID=630515 RepID=A0A1H1ZF28_9ACTN|nr:phosphonate ABC transporter ATP-binding protein [Microlunatus soli]SDT32318.1 phosphonate transport system ATP-binding protein [Microlunatus soli]